MKIMIIGASGLVGGSCFKILSAVDEWELLGTHKMFSTPETIYFDSCSFNPNDITFSPDVIVYCGGLTWVDYCEEHPGESYDANVAPIYKLTSWCKMINAKFVYTSSDYVFDGKNGPYQENDSPNPLNVYGSHKLEAENVIKSTLDNFIMLRFTNVYGEEDRNKNLLARLVEQTKSGAKVELNLANDQFASPVHSQDIGEALKCLIKDDRKGIFHLSSDDYLSRYEFAELLVKCLERSNININAMKTSSLNQKAKRPLKGGVLNSKFKKHYPSFKFTSLESHIKKLIL